MLVFLFLPFTLATFVYTLWWGIKVTVGKPEVLTDTHVAVSKWRSLLMLHTYLGAFLPCHFRCAPAHGLLALIHVALLIMFLCIFFLYFRPTTTEFYIISCCICALLPHTVRPLLNWGFMYSRFSDHAVESARRAMLLEAAATLKEKDYGSWRQRKDDYVSGNALEALDRIVLDDKDGGSYGSGKALRLTDGNATVEGGYGGPSSETKVDPLDDGYGSRSEASPSPNSGVFDNGELDVPHQDDFAFVGLFQPDRATPAPRPGRGAMDGPPGGATPYGRGHLDIFDFNDFDAASSYASSRRSSAAHSQSSSVSEGDLSPAELEAKRREEEAALFLYGHLADDDEARSQKSRLAEPAPAARAKRRHGGKSQSSRSKPSEVNRARRAEAPSESGSLKQLWQKSSLRTSTVSASNHFDEWLPSKPVAVASTVDSGSPRTASPYSAPSPKRGKHRNPRADALFDDYYGNEAASDGYDQSSFGGDTIDTVATAGNSLDEDEKGLPVPIATLHKYFFPLSVAMVISFLAADYVMSKQLSEQDQCGSSFQTAAAVAIGIDFILLQPLYLALTSLFRHLNSDEEDGTVFAELHPYEGEVREYWGLGDPTEGLKRMTSATDLVDNSALADGASRWF